MRIKPDPDCGRLPRLRCNNVDSVRSARPKGKRCRHIEKMGTVPFSPNFKEDRDCPLLRKRNKLSADFMNNSGVFELRLFKPCEKKGPGLSDFSITPFGGEPERPLEALQPGRFSSFSFCQPSVYPEASSSLCNRLRKAWPTHPSDKTLWFLWQ